MLGMAEEKCLHKGYVPQLRPCRTHILVSVYRHGAFGYNREPLVVDAIRSDNRFLGGAVHTSISFADRVSVGNKKGILPYKEENNKTQGE